MTPLNESGQLIWTVRLTLIVSGAAGLIGAGAVVAGLLGSAELAGTMGVISAVALVVAVSGRLTTKRSERWADAATPPSNIRIRRNRVVIRRRDVASRIMFFLCAATVVLVLSNAGPPSVQAAGIAVVSPITVFLALASFACRTVVTADELIVDTMFRRRLIPRRVVGVLRRTGQGAVGIAVVGQAHEILMPTGTNSLFIRGSWDYRPAEAQALDRLRAALDAVPPGPGGGDRVLVRRRFANIGLATLAAGTFLADVVLLVTHRLPG